MPSGFPHALSPEELAARRHAHVTAFLAARGLSPEWLTRVMRERTGDGRLLLTSSPVHGLANHTSDFDFIRIQEEELEGPRISIKIFEEGHHLEVVSFSRAELAANLEELERLAAAPPEETVAGFRAWDKVREPRRKQTERIVNGMALDGTAPYLEALPALSTVWSRASLQTAVEQVVHTALAEAAGETRGRVGYALNALLHVMDALLSYHGDVYTTRKWYLLRWARQVADGGWRTERLQALAADVERLRKGVHQALRPEAAAEPLAASYADLVRAAVRATGVGDDLSVRVEVTGDVHPYLPGAGLLLSRGGSGVVLPGAGAGTDLPFTTEATGLEGLLSLDAAAAGSLLRALRADAARLRIGYTRQEAGR
ncbi:DUF6001 family protein [Streptomyces sp. TRM64462]|uniref:DUF6001 family protein n=1 Tax=Streptomyces sp. TRM64462 TaxID=2741726 RepID=UPI001C30EC83|nr:DUF6001 family protein [Streptomyces sp. TRM64462]